MRIMQINAVSGILSTGRTTKELAAELQKRGHQTSIVYSSGYSDCGDEYHMDNQWDKKFHGLLSRITGLVGYYSRRETKKLLSYIESWAPDIVHIRNLHSNFINIPMILKYLGDKKIATVINLDDCFWFTGKCTHYTCTGCYKWQSECHHCPRIKRDNKSWIFDRTHKMQQDKKRLFANIPALSIVGVSKWVAEQASQSSIMETAKIDYVYNWIDIKEFYPIESDRRIRMHMEHDFIVLGVASNWSEGKGLDDFIKLSQIMHDVKFIILGNTPNNIIFPENMTVLPPTQNIQELVEFYAMADVFFNPSREETFGKVTAEAMACGTPAVVYNTTACPELIAPGCGAVVPLKDLKRAKEEILTIKANGKLYYKRNCIDFVKSHFEMTSCINKLIMIYNELIKD